MVRPTFAHIDLDAVRANYRAVLSYVGGGADRPDVIAVVKANGYGHGAVPVARALEASVSNRTFCSGHSQASGPMISRARRVCSGVTK